MVKVVAVASAAAATAWGVNSLTALSPGSQENDIMAMSFSSAASSEGYDVSVFLCKESDPWCDGRGVTEAERADVLRTLESRPEVEKVAYEDQQQAWKRFQEMYKDNSMLRDAARPSDMPESFQVRVKPEADARAVAVAASRLPGVATAVDQRCGKRQTRLRILIGRIFGGQEQCGFPRKER
ncbi:hypothetical protein SAMN05421505_12653 [Sinosporangium album]|uniref:FtsX extracellular domain-containing protein n=2 Tax=Sinosporangium album TaxID=504805 RepID=A0A1G8GB98_9ACTN|nr:hypothetical protein SAMN05421505_12653 [Sinosporangium album]